MLTAVNKTIRELTRAGAITGARSAYVELAKLTARRLDRAEDADDGAAVLKLTAQLRGILSELEPRGARGNGSIVSEPGSAVGGVAPPDLAGLLRSGPEVGNTP